MNPTMQKVAAVSTRIALAAAVAIGAAAVTATDADAHERHGHHRKHGRAHVVVPGHAYRIAPVVVPRVIRPTAVAVYRPYYADRVWHARHRHYHSLYRFPVETSYGVVYRPYAYCAGEVFHDYDDDRDRVGGYVQFAAPHVSIGIGF